MTLHERVAIKIKELREERRWSQAWLAKLIDSHANTISRWESGTYKPDLDDLEKLADCFGVPVSEFFGPGDDTRKHIARVQELMRECCGRLEKRAWKHDASKLKSPEAEVFEEYGPKLKECTYGSAEYKHNLGEMGRALEHHYEKNDHHPEHFENGVNQMDLFQLFEHLVDCKAASERHGDGDVFKSLSINMKRFEYGDQLYRILLNTAEVLIND